MAKEDPALEASRPDGFSAFPDEQYAGINHNRLLVVAVDALTRASIPCTFENIVVAAYRLFPRVFSLEGFTTYPDAARVNRTLLHCKPKYEDYINTSATGARGLFYLTPRGEEAARETLGAFSGVAKPLRGRAKVPRSHHEQILSDVRKSDAFQAWKSGLNVTDLDFLSLLHLLPGAKADAINDNFHIISESAAAIADPEVNSFLATLHDKLPRGS